jgi:hypothetical protein
MADRHRRFYRTNVTDVMSGRADTERIVAAAARNV